MHGELLIYNPELATTVHLNEPSLLVWNCCDGETSVGDIIDALQQTYPEQAEQIEVDVLNVFREFQANGLIVQTSAKP
jgi:hypothetical protein